MIHTAFLGDIVLATPFLAGLRSLLPAAEITFLTTPGGVALLTPNPWGVRAVAFDKRGKDSGLIGIWRKSRELGRFDLVFSLHRSIRSSVFARLAGKESWGFREAAGSFLLSRRVSRTGFGFEAEKNLAILGAWSGRGDFSPYPALAHGEEAEAGRLLTGLGKFVALAPSSVWATKRWPAEKFAELAARIEAELGRAVVVVGGAEDEAVANAVAEKALGVRNLAGKTSLGVLKSVLSRAELVVSNDSSPLHLGVALGAKVVGIFGPTARELGFFPLAPAGRAGVAEVAGLACRPCGKHGHDRCPLGHFRCMLDLGVDQVYGEVKRLLCP